jgi:chromosome segregation ATPase
MLEQNPTTSESLSFASFDISGVGPLSVSALRANASSASAPSRLSDLVGRTETLIAHLEARLTEERLASERAARTTAEIDERLRLGVRMLQAFDVQVERGEQASGRAQAALQQADETMRACAGTAEASIHALADRLAREKFEWLERELSWRFDRVKEVEERIEQAANGKLAWLDSELEQRLCTINDTVARAGQFLERSESAITRLEGTGELVDRAERATAALAGLTSEGQRHIETLVNRTGDASALREALGTLVHELAAAREVVQGDMRRMRDDLGWLVEKSERLTGELVERADQATQTSETLRATAAAAAPMMDELAAWSPLLSGTDRDRLRPIADTIAGTVRDELAADMRGFSSALRQLASRADGAFANIRVDTTLVAPDPKEFVRSFTNEISRLGHVAQVMPEIETASTIAVNRTIELDVGSVHV